MDPEAKYWMTVGNMDEWQWCDSVSPMDQFCNHPSENVGGGHASTVQNVIKSDAIEVVAKSGAPNPCTPNKMSSSSTSKLQSPLSPEKLALIERNRQAALTLRAKKMRTVTPDDEAAIFAAQQWLP